MRELAERSGVSAGTIKHYLREGLLGDGSEVVRTSRNMAYYPPDFVERMQLIKRLQEERYMPLRADPRGDGARARAGRGARRAARRDPRAGARGRAGERLRAAEVAARYPVPENVLERLAELGVLTPDERGYDAEDVRVIEAIARFREGGYDEALGFTVFDTLRYKEALDAARRGGGAHAAGPPDRRGQRRTRRRDHQLGQRRRCAS